ncbi:regulator SirB [Duganella sp. FT92W]|uniref:Regulator SirB n=1 Tax=Pseudoduganella rivuli TaxID=2666085 RepID=A0A7X2ILA9_9BURK|nr:SirB2 family protein [Pseudoduganella rivuli]MRV71818.1 regulator SirB [Pseudoduganella rivuli]
MDYHALKVLHMSCAAASGTLFLLRGGFMWRGAAWPRALRAVPHLVDTVLLGSALALAAWSGQSPLTQPWLAAKLSALVAYIVLGSVALKRGRAPAVRRAALLAALATLLYIVLVAVTRQPWPPAYWD